MKKKSMFGTWSGKSSEHTTSLSKVGYSEHDRNFGALESTRPAVESEN